MQLTRAMALDHGPDGGWTAGLAKAVALV